MKPNPPDFRALLADGNLALARPAAAVLARQWSALHRAAQAVSGLAGIAPAPASDAIVEFPGAIARLGNWRRNLAEQGVADLAAVMEPGLTALITAHKRGSDPTVPARTLLAEFITARDALLDLASGAIGGVEPAE